MKKIQLVVFSALMIAIGTGMFIYKYRVLNFPLKPNTTSPLWDIEVRLSFEAENKPVKASLFLPADPDHFMINSEQFLSGKYGLITEKKDKNRKAVWSLRKANGKQHLYYRILVEKTANKKQSPLKPPAIFPPELPNLNIAAAKRIWNEIYEISADIDTLIGNLFKRLNQAQTDEKIALLLGGTTASKTKKIQTAVLILSLAGIPSQPVYGFNLKEETLSVETVSWLEVYSQKKWHRYNPDDPGSRLPDSYFAWWRGSEPLYKIIGGTNSHLQISVQKNETEAIQSSILRNKQAYPRFFKFSLFNLPIQNQMVYRVILLIPLGALLVVIFRNIIGIKTFGTFMPVLIALSFRETQLIYGILLFSLIIAMGLGIRFYLEKLKLLVVPRLSAVLIAVVIIVAGLNILTHNMGLSLGLSISLFPIVILSMTIERMSILWDERGSVEALNQCAGTLFVSVAVYFLIKNQIIAHLMFFFPDCFLFYLASPCCWDGIPVSG